MQRFIQYVGALTCHAVHSCHGGRRGVAWIGSGCTAGVEVSHHSIASGDHCRVQRFG